MPRWSTVSRSNTWTDVARAGLGPRIIVALAAMYLLWGTSYLVTKMARTEFPPMLLVGVRYFCAGAVLACFARYQKRSWGDRRGWLSALAVGLLMITVGSGTSNTALPRVSSGLVAVMFAAVPLLVCMAMALRGKAVSALQWAGTVIGIGGLAMVTDTALDYQDSFSLWLVALGVLATALGSVLMDRLQMPQDLVVSASLQMMGGGAVSTLLGLLAGERVHSVSLAGLAQWSYLTFAVSVFAYMSYTYLMSKTGPVLANSFAYVNPPVALLAGALVLHEQVSPMLLLGTAVVLAGASTVLFASTSPARALASLPPGTSKP